MWTQKLAVELCRRIEAICPEYGCHVALTGGTLYKDGERKDCDILFYRIRQRKHIDGEGLIAALEQIGIYQITTAEDLTKWCSKFVYMPDDETELPMDIFMPEAASGEYGDSGPEEPIMEFVEPTGNTDTLESLFAP